MRHLILPLTGVAALMLPVPAAAQIAGKPDFGPIPRASPFLPDSSLPGPGIGREVRDLRERIGQAHEAGLISRREARALDREARLIGRLAHRYGRDGLSDAERRELEQRAQAVRAGVNRPRG